MLDEVYAQTEHHRQIARWVERLVAEQLRKAGCTAADLREIRFLTTDRRRPWDQWTPVLPSVFFDRELECKGNKDCTPIDLALPLALSAAKYVQRADVECDRNWVHLYDHVEGVGRKFKAEASRHKRQIAAGGSRGYLPFQTCTLNQLIKQMAGAPDAFGKSDKELWDQLFYKLAELDLEPVWVEPIAGQAAPSIKYEFKLNRREGKYEPKPISFSRFCRLIGEARANGDRRRIR